MTRLIDADSLLKMLDLREGWQHTSALRNLITNAPTVQREGWVSVPIEPTEEMKAVGAIETKEGERKFLHRTYIAENIYKAMLQAAPKLNEVKE